MAFNFSPPAKIVDFPSNILQQGLLDTIWTLWASGWTKEAILGNPWNETNASNQVFYANLLTTPIPSGTTPAQVPWIAMPGRINFYFPNLSQQDRWSLADTGHTTSGGTFPAIPPPSAVCSPPTQTPQPIPYGPYGPRGWQDEYCEWSVLRDANNNILRIDFTCENPEYWHALWRVSPQQVANLYNDTLGYTNITVDDLTLQFNGAPVIDPGTGQPVYNPLNPFNSGPTRTATSGGAMHLTSSPNTLQTELQLAGGATVARQTNTQNATALLCCGQYGQPRRNSDPTIGQTVNATVNPGGGVFKQVTLADPIGLYIQMPSFAGWAAPNGADPSQFWTVTRGVTSLPGFSNSNFILHATYEVPAEMGFTVSDISIGGSKIRWAAQIASMFNVALFPLAIPTTMTQQPAPCVTFPSVPAASPQPLQLMHANVWEALINTPVANPVGVAESLASNSVIVPAEVTPGRTYSMVLICDSLATPAPNLSVAFIRQATGRPDPNITVTVGDITPVTYTVPGNSYPSDYNAVSLTVTVGTALPGVRDVLVTNPGQAAGPPAIAFLAVSILPASQEVLS